MFHVKQSFDIVEYFKLQIEYCKIQKQDNDNI